MRVAAILFCGLFVVCQGIYLTDDKVDELIDLLKKATLQRKVPKLSRSYDASELAEPPTDESWMYDLDMMYEFPGADAIWQMVAKNFSDLTMHPGSMQDWPQGWPVFMDTYIRLVKPRWLSTMATFMGVHPGMAMYTEASPGIAMFWGNTYAISRLFAHQITEWVAHFRFSCPSTVFDKIIARWSIKVMIDDFMSGDESMFAFFYARLETLFSTYSPEELQQHAAEAVGATHSWIVQDMIMHLFGYGYKDIALFSHLLYWNFENNFREMRATSPTPETMPLRPIEELVEAAFLDAGVRCQTAADIRHRFATMVAMFRARYEEFTIEHISMNVEHHLWSLVRPEDRETMTFDPEVVRAISGRIRQYMETVLVDFERIESSLASSAAYTELQQFMEPLLDPEEAHVLLEMFQRLGFAIPA